MSAEIVIRAPSVDAAVSEGIRADMARMTVECPVCTQALRRPGQLDTQVRWDARPAT